MQGFENATFWWVLGWLGWLARPGGWLDRVANTLHTYTILSTPVESACRSSLLLAVCRLIADIKWKYPNYLNL